MVATGNDFIVAELRAGDLGLKNLAKNLCDRKYGVGADGLLILEKSKVADIKMRIFNADGSEAEMCANGARCVALWLSAKHKNKKNVGFSIETKSGIIQSEVSGGNVKIKLTDPKNLKLNIPIKINQRNLRVNFINTGVPHTVIFVQGLKNLDVCGLGGKIRYHSHFKPAGTNANFVEVFSNNSIGVRTYERGVEDETLACGTGSAAAALITAQKLQPKKIKKIEVSTAGGELLKVYFEKKENKFANVWLEGKARFVYEGKFLCEKGGNK
jgi:diaminopimelate epimerase